MQKYYSYNPITMELTGDGFPDPSPLEEDVFLYPAHCTTIRPPQPRPGNALVFDGSSWRYVEDHRGEVWYEGFHPVTINTLGPISPRLTKDPVFPADPQEDDPTEGMTLEEFSAHTRWLYEVGGVSWNGKIVSTDEASRGKLLMEVTAINLGARVDGSKWKFDDGEFHSLTNDEFMELALTVHNYTSRLFELEEEFKDGILKGEITTREQLNELYAQRVYVEDDEGEDGGDGDD